MISLMFGEFILTKRVVMLKTEGGSFCSTMLLSFVSSC